jgi:hypothetical protein
MIGGRRESALRLNARVLDRAVHATVPRLWPLAVPFVLLDISGFFYSFPFESSWLFGTLYGGLIANREHVLFASSIVRHDGRRVAWRSVFGSARTLWCAPVAGLSTLPPLLLGLMLVMPFLLWSRLVIPLMTPETYATAVALVVAGEAVAALVLAVTLLLVLAAAAATMDLVAEPAPAWPVLRRWLRWSFRRRTMWSTLLAGALYVLLFVGFSNATSALGWGPYRLNALAGIPNGIADTLSFAFVWQWRNAVLDSELGRDLIAELETTSTPPVAAAAPGYRVSSR